MRVLVTRPEEDGPRTAAQLAARGHEALLAPLFRVERLPATLPSEVDAIAAASANALRQADPASLRSLLDVPLFAVGEATAEAAREAGFHHVWTAGGDSRDLARLLQDRLTSGCRLLHLAGVPRRDEAIADLQDRFRLTVAETYETVAMAALPQAISHALDADRIDSVLHLSARAARVFGDLAANVGRLTAAQALLHVFISPAAVDSRFTRRRIAESPNLESVLDAL